MSEILEIMQTAPQKLSLAELFVAANSQPEGSDLYNRAFELAVTMFPSDETANFNAGVAALKRGDMVSADRYLSRAGNSSDAQYVRGVMKMLQGQEDEALEIFRIVSGGTGVGAQKAAEAVAAIVEIRETNGLTWRPLD